jgi:hypothetical protein
MKSQSGTSGQASVELVVGAAGLVVAGLLGLQLLGVGYAAVMASHASEAAAIAVANGQSPTRAARDAVPGWPERGIEVERRGGELRVTLEPPTLFRGLRGKLAISDRAYVRPRS